MNDKKNKNNVIEKRVRLNQKMAEIRPILIDVFVIMVPLMLLWIVELFFVRGQGGVIFIPVISFCQDKLSKHLLRGSYGTIMCGHWSLTLS